MRLDQYLCENGLAPSRQRGQALIMEGHVYIDGEKALKAGQAVPPGAGVTVRGDALRYVSRGGLKLEKGLNVFGPRPGGKICMDVGASTGGFTDCLLQHGAAKVYAVDVGYGQLAWSLRSDARVVVVERCNIRHITPDHIPDPIEFFTVDVSFISLKLVLPALAPLAAQPCEGICLVKPQFEAGREFVGKNGVVKDETVHARVIHSCIEYAKNSAYSVLGVDYSPVKGPKGNIEYLLHVRRCDVPAGPPQETVRQVCRLAHAALA